MLTQPRQLVLMPTTIEGKPALDVAAFLRALPDWADILNGTAQLSRKQEDIQRAFELACSEFWAACGEDEGFFPGTAVKAAFAKSVNEREASALPSPTDVRVAASAMQALALAKKAVEEQRNKVTMCQYQLMQSKKKLAAFEERVAEASKRAARFASIAEKASTDF